MSLFLSSTNSHTVLNKNNTKVAYTHFSTHTHTHTHAHTHACMRIHTHTHFGQTLSHHIWETKHKRPQRALPLQALLTNPTAHLLRQKRCDDTKVLGVLEVLLLEDLLLLVGPVRGVVLLLVDSHGVFQEAVVVQEAYATLPGVQHHRWDDRQHAHLLVFLLLTKPHRFHFQGIVGYKMYCVMETEIHARVCACVGVIFAALFNFCTGILTHSPQPPIMFFVKCSGLLKEFAL